MLTKLPQGTLINRADSIGRSLLASWRFNEGGGLTAFDGAGRNHGTLTNGPTWSIGPRGKVLSFDGTNDYVNVSNTNASDFNFDHTIPFTIAFWFKPNNITQTAYLPNKRANGGDFQGWLTLQAAAKLEFQIRRNATERLIIDSSSDILVANQWQFITFTYDATNAASGMAIYRNGVLTTSTSTVDNPLTGSIANSSDFRIGARVDGLFPFNGSFDSVIICRRVLRQKEVIRLYEDFDCYLVQPRKLRISGVFIDSSVDVSVTVTGTEVLEESGTPTVSSEQNLTTSGVEVLVETGDVDVETSGSISILITGDAALVETGTVTFATDSNLTVTGDEILAETGTVIVITASSDITITVVGKSVRVQTNNPTVSTPLIPIDLCGVVKKTRRSSTFVTKRRTYLNFPAIEILNNIWRGSSEIVLQLNFTLDAKNSFPEFLQYLSHDVNFCACIAWKPTDDTIVRYKLWNDVGEILYVPLYNGETTPSSFRIEIWNTPDTDLYSAALKIYLSKLVNVTGLCPEGDIEVGLDYRNCTDLTFDLTNYVPVQGDYYVRVGDCGEMDLVKGELYPSIKLEVQSEDDNTWHELTYVDIGDGILYLNLGQEETTPGTPIYLKSDRTRGIFKLIATKFNDVYYTDVEEVFDRTSAPNIAMLLAPDGKYYGLRVITDEFGIITTLATATNFSITI